MTSNPAPWEITPDAPRGAQSQRDAPIALISPLVPQPIRAREPLSAVLNDIGAPPLTGVAASATTTAAVAGDGAFGQEHHNANGTAVPFGSGGGALGGDEVSSDEEFDPATGALVRSNARGVASRDPFYLPRPPPPPDPSTLDLAVTPFTPHRDRALMRDRSRRILHDASEDVAHHLGVPPRLFYDRKSGFLLSRDSVVSAPQPLRLADATGAETLVTPPATGFGLSREHTALEKDGAANAAVTVHYRRSIEAMQVARQERLVRALGL
jgi:hypothetical protein